MRYGQQRMLMGALYGAVIATLVLGLSAVAIAIFAPKKASECFAQIGVAWDGLKKKREKPADALQEECERLRQQLATRAQAPVTE
jgi:Sec-independent protein translocase protein TatA